MSSLPDEGTDEGCPGWLFPHAKRQSSLFDIHDPAANILYDMQKSVFIRNKLLLTGNYLEAFHSIELCLREFVKKMVFSWSG